MAEHYTTEFGRTGHEAWWSWRCACGVYAAGFPAADDAADSYGDHRADVAEAEDQDALLRVVGKGATAAEAYYAFHDAYSAYRVGGASAEEAQSKTHHLNSALMWAMAELRVSWRVLPAHLRARLEEEGG